MRVTVGTFNLNNLFSRFNFSGAVQQIEAADGSAGAVTVRYEFTDPQTFWLRTFLGRLVKQKEPAATKVVAERVLNMDVDVLSVQEVEDIDTLRAFNRDHLDGLYPYQVLIEGNDARFIDVGVLSRLPIGAVTSYQTAVHPDDPSARVFSRDLLEVEILGPTRAGRLFTLYNTHLKSHFGDGDRGGRGRAGNDTRRRRQAETVARLVATRMQPDSPYIVTGDMNDPPAAAPLAPMLTIHGQVLVNALATPAETRPPKPETTGPTPADPAWTHRFKASGQPPRHELFDQIWLSPALGPALQGATIDRRTKHRGDGTDHDPAWIELEL